MPNKLIQQGAEAKIFQSKNKVIKDRIKKSYRIEFLDTKITVMALMPLDEKITKSISHIFPNARIFEDEINKQYDIVFEE